MNKLIISLLFCSIASAMQKSITITTDYSPTVTTLNKSLSSWCTKDVDQSQKEAKIEDEENSLPEFVIRKFASLQVETAQELRPLAKSQPHLAEYLAERAERENLEFSMRLALAFAKAQAYLDEREKNGHEKAKEIFKQKDLL